MAGTALVAVTILTPIHGQEASSLPANVPAPNGVVAGAPAGVRFITPPPAGIDPLTASSPLKAIYSLPPAPPASAPAKLRSDWQKAVSDAAKAHLLQTPLLKPTNITHRPVQKLGRPAPVEGTINSVLAQSSNWSGNSIVDPSNPFQTAAVIAEFVVPTARPAFGMCSGTWDYSSLWGGIDGNGSNDALQAGVEVDAYCSGGLTAALYSAWVEWYPYPSIQVSAPAMNPGDLVLVEIYSTSPTTAVAYFFNISTQQSAGYSLAAPSGISLVGNSVQWIIERPVVDGQLSTLTNYIDASWPVGYAWNYATGSYVSPGLDPASGILETITMLDDAGNPISSAAIENADFLYFTNSGSSF